MSKILEIVLGIVTSIGGYLDAGSLATSVQAGAVFRYDLLWVILLGTICVIFLVEMSGRFAAVSNHPIYAAMRERQGANYFMLVTVVNVIVNILVLAAELGGAAMALQLLTGISIRVWVIPVALLLWLMLWVLTFKVIENGVAALGMITVVFLVVAWRLHPQVGDILHGFIPSSPQHDKANYWFLAVSIMGSIIAPYLFHFYSSGAIEDQWDHEYLVPNRIIATVGMSFGSAVSMAALVVAAVVLFPRHISAQTYEEAALMLTTPLGHAGLFWFSAALFIACMGAAFELSLSVGYILGQGLGWQWGEDEKPIEAPRFALVYTIATLLATIPSLIGLDPLKVTLISMALTALILPLVIFPFLLLMNDREYLEDHVNSRFSNIVVLVVILLSSVMALVSLPLELMGGS